MPAGVYRVEWIGERLARHVGGDVYIGHELHCPQGHGGSSGSESDMPDISVGDVCAGTAVDFV